MVKIFIDPGHGGADPGAVANGLKEKDICLMIGILLRDFLNKEYVGHRIKLSRETDISLTLKERTDLANSWGADYLVSIHVNAGGGTGFESFIYNGRYANKARTSQLRNNIHDKIVQDTGYRDRGKKEANFHMLRESRMPAMLTENGFIDHSSDARLLQDLEFLSVIAWGHARGIAETFGLRKKSSSSKRSAKEPNPTKDNGLTSKNSIGKQNPIKSKGLQQSSSDDKSSAQLQGNGLKSKSIGAKTQDSEKSRVMNHQSRSFQQKHHIIQKGDTLWSLAKRYGTTVEKLMAWNQSVIPEQLQIGQKLIVGESRDSMTHHTIRPGDTLWGLGIKYGTTVEKLIALNHGIDPKRLQIGDRIRIK